MKTLQQIKQAAEKGDYTRVAQMVGKTPDLVKKVINDLRADHHGIQKTFSDMLENRERIMQREHKRRSRQAA